MKIGVNKEDTGEVQPENAAPQTLLSLLARYLLGLHLSNWEAMRGYVLQNAISHKERLERVLMKMN